MMCEYDYEFNWDTDDWNLLKNDEIVASLYIPYDDFFKELVPLLNTLQTETNALRQRVAELEAELEGCQEGYRHLGY